ncbi:4-amino-4-deoxy-L-arabinose transferase [Geodermatophilus amargosae]|uniref:4-amino-4-deoxy-L-arabinose transferase n=1 Tax=Geodermatophilus amargosae TaxID=1296565 RepID=A0A1I7ANY3_9ACTN|nr:glycosyltransferase family 39 protein [Geodermatophilus amargosae]SFT76566.1 4-amino-4-deoxy-L-arabinose transferase [Geodermatophilus amargosae]
MSTVLEHIDVVEPDEARPAGPAHAAPRRGSERLRVGLALIVIGVAHSLNLAGWPRYFDDEGTYYSQAWSVLNMGSLAPYTYWYDHPPAGWLQMALFSWLPEALLADDVNSDLLAGRILMVAYTLVTALLLYVLAKRLGMARGWALAAMLLWALNPLVVYEGRQVFLDNIALPWLVGAFVLVLDRRRHLGHHMAGGLCFGVAVLSKETVLVFLPALLVALWQSAYRPTRPFAIMGFSAVVAISGSTYLLYALIRDELFPGPDHVSIWDALAFQLGGREGSGWLLDPDGPSDGAYDALSGWLHFDDGVLVVGGVAAALVTLAVRRLRPVGIAVLVVTLVALRPSGYLPQMYVVAVLPFCALALAGLLDVAWRWLMRARTAPVRVISAASMLAALAAATVPLADWRYDYATAWTADTNDVRSATAAYVEDDLPRDATIVVDNTLWNDLVDAGWATEDVVWFYKVDSDGAVMEQLGGDYLGIDYLVWSDNVARNAGPIVVEAYDHSELLRTAGEGDARIEVRRVLPLAEQARIQAVEDEAERQRLEAFLTAPSAEFTDLTNGQIEGIKVDQATLSVPELAAKYVTSQETILTILDE